MRLSLVVLGVMLASCAQRTHVRTLEDPQSLFLQAWKPPKGQRCTEARPDPEPPVDSLVDLVELRKDLSSAAPLSAVVALKLGSHSEDRARTFPLLGNDLDNDSVVVLQASVVDTSRLSCARPSRNICVAVRCGSQEFIRASRDRFSHRGGSASSSLPASDAQRCAC